MPIRMDISPIDRLVVIVARGPVSPEEIAEKTTTLVAATVPGYAKIIDVTGSSSDLTRDQVERIAALFRGGPEAPSRGAVAFVVNPDRRGFAEAFASVTQGERPIELFRSLHAARRWLRNAAPGASRPAASPADDLHPDTPLADDKREDGQLHGDQMHGGVRVRG